MPFVSLPNRNLRPPAVHLIPPWPCEAQEKADQPIAGFNPDMAKRVVRNVDDFSIWQVLPVSAACAPPRLLFPCFAGRGRLQLCVCARVRVCATKLCAPAKSACA